MTFRLHRCQQVTQAQRALTDCELQEPKEHGRNTEHRVNEFSQREALRAWSRVTSAHLDTATGFTTHKPLWLWNAICKMGTEISSWVAVKSDCISVLCLPQSLTECSWFWIFGSGYHHFIWGLWPTGWNIPVVQKRVPKIKPSEKHLKQPGWFNLDHSSQGGGTTEHLKDSSESRPI